MSTDAFTERLGTIKTDFIQGNDGRDLIIGRHGRDVLLGKGGDDRIEAGHGNDILAGGAGNDMLYGGKGRDTYQWNLAEIQPGDHDTLFDDRGSRLQLDDDLLAQLLLNGKPLDSLKSRKVVGDTIDADNSIAWQNGSLLIDLDGNGQFDPTTDTQIEIVGNATRLSFAASSDLLILG
ncbi:Hemolysin, chromosomal [compost metagenome]